jgi:hypothetical protein
MLRRANFCRDADPSPFRVKAKPAHDFIASAIESSEGLHTGAYRTLSVNSGEDIS